MSPVNVLAIAERTCRRAYPDDSHDERIDIYVPLKVLILRRACPACAWDFTLGGDDYDFVEGRDLEYDPLDYDREIAVFVRRRD